MNERSSFLAAIEAAPLDHLLRCVFADWLDEQGEVEEATRQRAWVGAYEYLLKNFVNPYGEEGEETPSHAEAMQAIEYWRDCLLEDGLICFHTDQAAENMYDEEHRTAFYRNLEIVTGTPILPEARARASIRCAC